MNQPRVVRNTAYVGAAVVGGGLLQLVTQLAAARVLGPERFGTYAYVLAFAWISQQIADCGLTDILVQELATRRDQAARIFESTKILISVLSLIAAAAAAIILLILPLVPFTKGLIAVMFVGMLVLFRSAGYAAAIKAREEMRYTAAGFFFHKVFLLIAISFCLWRGVGLCWIAAAHLAANLALCGFYRTIVRRRYYPVAPFPGFQWAEWLALIKRALPLGAGSGFYSAAPQIDTVILRHLATHTAVGLFSAPLRLVQAPNMVPGYLAASLFPWLSKLAVEGGPELEKACARSLRFFAMLGAPAAAAGFVCAPALVVGILSREYRDSIPGLEILALSIAPVFLTALLPYIFTAVHSQRLFLSVCLVSLLVRSGLNFILTPHWGFLGACTSLTVGELLCLSLGLLALRHGVKIRLALLSILWKPLAAAILMGVALYPVRTAPLPRLTLGLLLAGAVYLGALWVLRALTAEELRSVLHSLPFGRRLFPTPAPVAHE